MKKIIILFIICLMGVKSFSSFPPGIDEKLVQTFKTLFPNAKEVKWYESPDKYQVYFEEGGIKTRILYWKDGLYVQFLRYYLEGNLPSYIQYKIKKEFPGKTISSITELSIISGPDQNLKVEYNIKLEDAKTWMTVRLNADGYSKVIERFSKI